MSSDPFTIKRNDQLPVLERQLLNSDDSAINLTTATAVQFHLKPVDGGAVKIDAAATVTDAANGRVEYAWAVGDTDTSGKYHGEFEITFPGGTLTVPNDAPMIVTIKDDLA